MPYQAYTSTTTPPCKLLLARRLKNCGKKGNHLEAEHDVPPIKLQKRRISLMTTRLEQWTLHDLFTHQLRIPDYQRSYSWRSSHVIDLLKDTFGRTSPYLMGTVILHEKDGNCTLDIVDGQQRLVTLTVLLHELKNGQNSLPLLDVKFTEGAAMVIRNTRKVIRDFLSVKKDAEKKHYSDFLFSNSSNTNGCLQFAVLILNGANALDRAYIFFDSVNSKGKSLTDFDLLKAHHLMFIPPKLESLATSHNDEWQHRDEKHFDIFSTTLRRLRMWARGQERDNKQEWADYNEFCSVVEPEHEADSEHKFNRYMQPVAFRSWRRMADKIVLSMDYPVLDSEALMPTTVTQTIEGGDAFFLYAKHYHELYETLFTPDTRMLSTAVAFIRGLENHMDNLYLRNAFRAITLLYVDKFGEDRLIEIGVCCERIISALRWNTNSLRIEGTLTHVKNNRLVQIMLDSVYSLHAYTQLFAVAQTQPYYSALPASNVKNRYFNSMKQFYKQEQSKICDDRTRSIISFYFNTDN